MLSGPEKDKLDAAISGLSEKYQRVTRLRWIEKLRPTALAVPLGVTRQEAHRQCGVAVDHLYKAVNGIVTERKKLAVVICKKAETAELEPVRAAKIEQLQKIRIRFIDAIERGLVPTN